MAAITLSPALLTQPIGYIDRNNRDQVFPTLQFTKVIQQIYSAQNSGAGSGTVTSVGATFTGGLISITGTPVTSNGTLAFKVGGTSGGIPFFASATGWASSAVLAANALVVGGGAGTAPATVTTGTGVLAALATNVGSPGAFLVQGGGGGVSILGQSGLPMIVVGSGSMGNNGTLTLTTSLGVTYPNAYVYMPAGAIVTASAAGWYYATFSSGTAGTVFNNTYTSGTPLIPPSPTAFATTGPGAYTGSSAAQTAYSLTVPANTLGKNGAIRTTLAASYTNTAANKTFTINYGGTAFGSAVVTTTAALAVMWGFRNRGATGVQIGTMTPNAVPFGASTTAFNIGTVDSTSSQSLILTVTNATPATNNAVLENIAVELLGGVA